MTEPLSKADCLFLFDCIEKWKANAQRAVYALGALQGSPQHIKLWYDSSPVRIDPNSNRGRGFYLPSGTLEGSISLISFIQNHFSKRSTAVLTRLHKAFEALDQFVRRSTANRPTLPPIAKIEHDLARVLLQLTSLENLVREHLVGINAKKPKTVLRNGETMEDFAPASWFTQNTKVTAGRLRHAARRKSKNVRKIIVDGPPLYSKRDATKWWANDMQPNASK